MSSPIKYPSDPNYRREHQGSVEKNSDNVLVIRDKPASTHMKTLSWIMVAAIPVIAVLGAITPQNVLAVIMLILVLLASISFIARRIITEIDLAERTIRRTWKIGVLAWHRVYSLGDYATAEIKVKGQVIEGYSLPFFAVNLAGTGRHIKIYSTDDAKDATAVYIAITGFLDGAGISTQKQQAG
jgi:hypothetical protein